MASFFFSLILFLFFFIISPSSSSTITLTLSPLPKPKSFSNPWEFTSNLINSSIKRALHLKNPKKNNTSSSSFHGTTNTSLYPRSYGGYSVSLAFGTPPQIIPLVFDTGSSFNWVPCTSRYACFNCKLSGVDPSNITTFKPKLSSSTRIVGCKDPKCGLIFGPDVKSRCGPKCGSISNCTRACPNYILQYGLGSTSGVSISETLDLPGTPVKDFLLGCSVLSIRQPEGIAGFGRAPTSLPNQLKLSKFSYCLLSHKLDDSPKSSKLILTSIGKKNLKSEIQYTPLLKNPTSAPYNEYYYVHLRKITIGKNTVKLPYKYLTPDSNGSGGTIIDSGTTITFMERSLLNPLVKELAAQYSNYKRAKDIEAQSGFGLCLNIISVQPLQNVTFPELVFHFKGGAKMVMPLANYFSFVGDLGVVCLTIVTNDSPAAPSIQIGPAVILGNYLQQNFYIEYDLENQRLGFKKEKCG